MRQPGPQHAAALEKARRVLDLPPVELYHRYLALTGCASAQDVDAHLLNLDGNLPPAEHDKLVLAINECYLERGLPDRLPFLQP